MYVSPLRSYKLYPNSFLAILLPALLHTPNHLSVLVFPSLSNSFIVSTKVLNRGLDGCNASETSEEVNVINNIFPCKRNATRPVSNKNTYQ